MEKGKISVIVPVYNAEKYLKECLDSIFAQTWQNFEVLCIDDGSKDASVKILDEYSREHAEMRFFLQKNGGPGAARNFGLEQASGEYVAFVDSDDRIAPGYFAAAVKKLEEDGADLVMSNPMILDMLDDCRHPYRNMLNFYRWSRMGGFPVEEQPLLLTCIGCWDKFYRKSLLDENGIKFPAPRIFEDAPFGIYAQICANKISVLQDSYYDYRKNVGTSITDREIDNARYRKDFLQNLQEMRAFMLSRGCGEKIWAGVLFYVLRDGMYHLCNTRRRKEFRDFFLALSDSFSAEEWGNVRYFSEEKINWFADVLIRKDIAACRRKIVMYLNLPLRNSP